MPIKLSNYKIIAIQSIIIILLSSLLIPIVHGETSNTFITKTVEIRKIITDNKVIINFGTTSEKADLILKRFYDIEKNNSSIEKIKNQIEVLTDFNIITYEDIPRKIIYILNKSDTTLKEIPNNLNLLIGPTIISHFILSGRIYGTNFNLSFFYNHSVKSMNGFIENLSLDKVFGAFPIYLGVSFKPVFITVFSKKYSVGLSKIYFPFFEILSPCLDISIRIINENNNNDPTIYFEYNLDFCLYAILKGLSF